MERKEGRTMDTVAFNITLFFVTLVSYWVLWQFVTGNAGPKARGFRKGDFHALWIIALLVMPISVNGTVFTVLGNAKAEKNMYAVASVYQETGGDAFNVVSISWQIAGNDAIFLFGIAYQDAGHVALHGLGVSSQYSKIALQAFGIAYQHADHAAQLLGIAKQDVGKEALQIAGIAWQYAVEGAAQGIGVSYQSAGKMARSVFGVAIVQRVPGKERTFSFWTTLTADE